MNLLIFLDIKIRLQNNYYFSQLQMFYYKMFGFVVFLLQKIFTLIPQHYSLTLFISA